MSYSNLAAYITLSFQWGGGISLAPQDSSSPRRPPPRPPPPPQGKALYVA